MAALDIDQQHAHVLYLILSTALTGIVTALGAVNGPPEVISLNVADFMQLLTARNFTSPVKTSCLIDFNEHKIKYMI